MTERRLERQLALDATPEQVWEAIATGPGIATWFVPHRVEPHEGGTVEQDYGGATTTGRVTAWEPGKKFASRVWWTSRATSSWGSAPRARCTGSAPRATPDAV